jgi:hypothetical protein
MRSCLCHKRNFLLIFLLVSKLLTNGQTNEMKANKDRFLTRQEFEDYIKDHHGIKIDSPYLNKTGNVFYACDDDILLSNSPKRNTYLLKRNRESILHDWNLAEKRRTYYPLTRFEQYLEDFSDSTRELLIRELFQNLGMPLPEMQALSQVDLKVMDNKLNKLGDEYVYDNLPLHLAVFCGERMKQQLGGGAWRIREDPIYDTNSVNIIRMDKTPIFVTPIDKAEIDFVFKILKNLNEYKKARLRLMPGL